ncbi:hypothetical protein Nepgr_020224 [Nepenthes gracilis]|uniref:FAD-binding FR-type domain-containing protein n=1 Tax=Nepenthes gracilis TaxID=150966 RepID=A0AAD3SVP1_NEPGR|nr:hypothetical protein Nepgr_020224 [Nepenthes gracilis]
MAMEVQKRMPENRIRGKYLLGVHILSCHQRIIGFAPRRPHVRIKHQVSHMARSPDHAARHFAWRRLRHLLGHDRSNANGEIAFVVSIPMWATSFALIRRKKFEVFYYTHHLYVLFAFFYILHIGAAYLCMILPGIFLFLIDRYLRFLQSRGHVQLDSARLLPCGIIELSFAKNPGLQYNPGSILFVNIPQISKLQWHPFTVTSNSNLEPNRLSIAIKSAGDWTGKLYQELSSSSCPDNLQVSIEGPYGPTSSHFLRHESLVLISGGSGIATFISIIREIILLSNKPSARVPHILLICSFKHAADLGLLDLLLPIDSNHLGGISNTQMQIQAYVTRDTEPPTTDNGKLVRTKRFKPNPSDSPIDAALGPNNWIWLCVIILSSFVLFVVLLGLVTRYHIYPIDHNTGQKYHFTVWCLWVILFMFSGVFAATSCVFLWQKRKVAAKGKQVQNAVTAAPETSPETRFCGGDGEVESQPHQSLVQATQVHYGGRPNIRKILLEHKGCDVGVIASGPREMRNEVAKVCSSHAANNLHFGCISFTW